MMFAIEHLPNISPRRRPWLHQRARRRWQAVWVCIFASWITATGGNSGSHDDAGGLMSGLIGGTAVSAADPRSQAAAPQGQPAATPTTDPLALYRDHLKPLFHERCNACHGSLKQEAGLRLDAGQLVLRGGDSGALIQPGDPATSLLMERLRGGEGIERMPPEGAPLTEEQLGWVADWIAGGGLAPEEAVPENPRNHWAFQRPRRPPLPDRVALANSLPASARDDHPVDRFIDQALADHGCEPLPPAALEVQVRRLYLDLLGIPPTPAERAEFLADTRPDAWEQLVDRLLDRPEYGERWARHWLDVWRYSDWDGFRDEVRESQPHIWRWRDWTIASLNADKPYDQMVCEMLAGDELAPLDESVLSATGFLVRSYHKFNRNTWLDNTVEHTGKALFGLTLNCSRCHDHKYDPIEQLEYYRLRAIFEPVGVRIDPVSAEWDPRQDGLARIFDEKPESPTYFFVRGEENQAVTTQPLSPQIPVVLRGTATAVENPASSVDVADRTAAAEFAVQSVALPRVAAQPWLRSSAVSGRRAELRRRVDEASAATEQARALWSATSQALNQSGELTERDRRPRLSDERPVPAAALPAFARVGSDPNASSAGWSEIFSAASRQRWRPRTGDWLFTSQGVRQRHLRQDFCRLEASQPHPRDFAANVRLVIHRGAEFRSAGLLFDGQSNERFHAAYISAHGARPAVEVFSRTEGRDDYRAELQSPCPIEVDREYQLEVLVRDNLINLRVDDTLRLAARLTGPRAPGEFGLWTFDAVAEFLECRVQPLDDSVVLVPPVGDRETAANVQTDTAAELATRERAYRLAELNEQVARSELHAWECRLAVALADGEATAAGPAADSSLPDSASPDSLKKAAIEAEVEAALAVAAKQQFELEAQLAAAGDSEPELAKLREQLAQLEASREAAVKRRDDPEATVTPLGPDFPAASTGRRLQFAQLAVSRENPLAARVAINHLWLRHFGSALVPTVFDFGLNGARPTHPELLDWLAVELMDQGWRMKPIHRLLVTSQAYRRASSGSEMAKCEAVDRDNRLLWRANVRRMEAEAVRDSVLAVAGLLESSTGGPDLSPAEDQRPVRSIYFRHSREKRLLLNEVFDSASVAECYRRNETVVPQQALALMNSQLAATAAAVVADGDSELGDEEFTEAAWIRVLSRRPTAAERTATLRFLQQDPNARVSDADNGPSVRERLIRVLFNHNDFVSIR